MSWALAVNRFLSDLGHEAGNCPAQRFSRLDALHAIATPSKIIIDLVKL